MAKQQKVTIAIPEVYGPAERQAIGQAIVDFIVLRTREQNLDKNGRSLGRYSDSYAASLDFKIAGKRKGTVDLTLSGEMMDALELLNTRQPGQVVIGYSRGDKINGKVEGNRLGTYGNRKKVAKARDFLGITETAKRAILANFPIRQREESRQLAEEILETRSVSTEIIRDTFDLEEE